MNNSNDKSFVKVWIPLNLVESFDENSIPKEYYLEAKENTICIHIPVSRFKQWKTPKILLKG